MPSTLRVGMIGYNFMGKAHSNAWRQVNRFFPDLPGQVELSSVCGRHREAVENAARVLGWSRAATDWRVPPQRRLNGGARASPRTLAPSHSLT